MEIFSDIVKWWKQRNALEERQELYVILQQSINCKSYEERIHWIRTLFVWLRNNKNEPSEVANEENNVVSLRIKFLLQSLNNHPEWKTAFISSFKQVIVEISSIEFFSEIGLNYQGSFINEFSRRLMDKLLIEGSPKKDLKTLLFYIFPSETDSIWIDLIDGEVLEQFIELFRDHENINYWHPVEKDIENAILLMVKKVQAIGLGPTIRKRIHYDNFRTLPFFELSDKAYKFIFSYDQSTPDPKQLQLSETEFLNCVQSCRVLLMEVYTYLESHGVSISVVFSLEQMFRQLDRIALLVRLRTTTSHQAKLIRMFLSQFVLDLHNSETISSFVTNNIQLILKKVVQRNSEIGGNYFAETKKQYYKILKKSFGGGFLTGFTVFIKFIIVSLPFSQFAVGMIATINYAASFLAIQFMGFTLATKQPASTAPTLAKHLQGVKTKSEIDEFIQDALFVIRAQVSSVFGNILTVIPTAAVISYIVYFIFQTPHLSLEKSSYVLHSFDIFGPSAIYAIFTGFLLFSSSIMAGWVDNWFVLNRLDERIAGNEAITKSIGESRAEALGVFFRKNIAGITGNVSLGFFLGLLPEILKFLGIPLDVRHVTLTAGSIFYVLPTTGPEVLLSSDFIRAFLGMLLIGVMNVASSFFFALIFAVRAENISSRKRNSIFRRLFYKVISEPWLAIFPINSRQHPKVQGDH